MKTKNYVWYKVKAQISILSRIFFQPELWIVSIYKQPNKWLYSFSITSRLGCYGERRMIRASTSIHVPCRKRTLPRPRGSSAPRRSLRRRPCCSLAMMVSAAWRGHDPTHWRNSATALHIAEKRKGTDDEDVLIRCILNPLSSSWPKRWPTPILIYILCVDPNIHIIDQLINSPERT